MHIVRHTLRCNCNGFWHTQHAYRATAMPDRRVVARHLGTNKQRATQANCPVVNGQSQSRSCVPHHHFNSRPQRQTCLRHKNDKAVSWTATRGSGENHEWCWSDLTLDGRERKQAIQGQNAEVTVGHDNRWPCHKSFSQKTQITHLG